MRKFVLYLFMVHLGLIVQPLVAQPAIFNNSILSIPQGAAIVNGEPSYYNNIQLISDIEGNFTLLAAQQSNLVSVDTVVVTVLQSFPVQVSVIVAGNKSVPCVQLQTPAVVRNGSVFTVILAETTLGPAESCIAVLDPFETSIPLDVAGLAAGSYKVSVNGVEAEFSL